MSVASFPRLLNAYVFAKNGFPEEKKRAAIATVGFIHELQATAAAKYVRACSIILCNYSHCSQKGEEYVPYCGFKVL